MSHPPARSGRFFVAARLRWVAGSALVGLGALAAGCADAPAAPDLPPTEVTQPATYAAPLIGSGGFAYRNGSAFPGAAAPHGLAKVGPDTKGPWGTVGFLHFSGYWYGDDTVQGFSHLHLHGTGATDYGVLGVMPLDDFSAERTRPDGYGSLMRKETEEASPGYYAVTLRRGNIRSELVATTHAAQHRYRFDDAVRRKALLFDLDHHLESGEISSAELKLDAALNRLSGHLRSVGGMSRGFGGYELYFAARTRAPWREALVWSEGAAPAAGTQATGKGVGAVLIFDSAQTSAGPAGEPIELQVGLSLVSEENAAANLESELPAWDLEQTRNKTLASWEALLKTLRITGGSEPERRMFYSALYRSFLMPSTHSDVDGRYLGFDGKIHQADGFNYVSDLSLWDTYRTLHPLYSLIAPTAALDSVRSLLAMAQARGAFPKWPLAGGDSGSMIGAPAELVVADAYLKGITGFDAEAAYQILRAAAMDGTAPTGGRGGRDHVEDYLRLGYVPSYVSGSVSLTTEYARGDFALSQLAAALGHASDAQLFGERARSYRNLYDAKSGFLRGRAADGTFSWMTYSPTKYGEEYVEANGWQSLWMNDHDAAGLSAMLGGDAALVSKLSQMFEGTRADWDASDQSAAQFGAELPAYYWPGNEPDIHAAYLFALLGRPELTSRWVRWLMATQYNDSATGLPGNDDGGTMSAWYIFSALGFYPIVGSDRYVLAAPLFARIEIALAGGVFTIEAPGVSAERSHVEAITLDGVPLTGRELRHSELRAGRTLHFTMGPMPAGAQ